MMNEKFKKALKSGGKELILANVGCIIISYIIGYFVMGKNIVGFINSSTGMGEYGAPTLAAEIFVIAQMLFAVLISSGVYASSENVIENEEFNIAIFFRNSIKNFWKTLGYSIAYCFGYGLIVVLPVYVVFSIIEGIFHIDIKIATFIVINLLMTMIVTPKLVLGILGKDSDKYIKRNWKCILPVSIIQVALMYIPVIGAVLAAVICSIYPLFILSLWKETEIKSGVKTKIIQLNGN